MQVRAALETTRCPEPAESSPPATELISVAFDAKTASVDLDPTRSLDKVEEEVEKKMDGVDSSSDEYTTSLLPEPSAAEDRSCLTKCYAAYRSPNSGSRVTPFAIILLIVLLVIYVLNQADRLVLAVLIPSGLRCYEDFNSTSNSTCSEPIGDNETYIERNSTDCIHFDNFEQGLLTGPAFTIVYVVAGLPLAWLADTASRPLVLLIGLAFWSSMMILSGSVTVFWQLLVLRILLGVGEVSLYDLCYSTLILVITRPPTIQLFTLCLLTTSQHGIEHASCLYTTMEYTLVRQDEYCYSIPSSGYRWGLWLDVWSHQCNTKLEMDIPHSGNCWITVCTHGLSGAMGAKDSKREEKSTKKRKESLHYKGIDAIIIMQCLLLVVL